VLSKATLDIISLSALGHKLDSLSSYSRFAEAYHTIFEFPALGLLVAFINQYIPIRSWLPLKVNLDFVQANLDIRKFLRNQIRERKRQVLENSDAVKGNDGNKRDLLTLMIEEKSGGSDPWTEIEIRDHVRLFCSMKVTSYDFNR
jgi:cytochrome P450